MWKQIEDTNYEVSNEGVFRNLTTKIIIKGSISTSGYKMVSLHVNGKRITKQVHRLVALAFIDNPENKPQVNHKDSDKLNNHIDNLEWVTPKENMKHHYDNGGIKNNNQTYKGKFGINHNRSIKIICDGVIYNGMSEASRITGIPISTISLAIKQNRKCKGMHFQLRSI
jgi:hypothetical protein